MVVGHEGLESTDLMEPLGLTGGNDADDPLEPVINFPKLFWAIGGRNRVNHPANERPLLIMWIDHQEGEPHWREHFTSEIIVKGPKGCGSCSNHDGVRPIYLIAIITS